MKVVVVGANGQIGQHLVALLQKEDGFEPYAMVRKEEQERFFEEKGVKAVLANLEDRVEKLEEAVQGMDAIVFSAGSGGSTGADKTLLIDLDGAVKMMEAAENTGIDRFIMVSAHQAHNRENWSEAIKPYYVAKHYADRMLEQSNLIYTIIRPGNLLNEVGTGKIQTAKNLESGSIPREDVARTILAALKEENTHKKAFDLISGNASIKESLEKLTD